MGLIDLKTNLKDLKFGHDRYKWGSSKEPYIQTRIPATDEPLQTSVSLSADNIANGLGFALLGAGAGAIVGGSTGAIVGAGLGIVTAAATQGFEVRLELPSAGTGGPDFLLRGGTLLPNILIDDAIRLTKVFTDTKGILFAVKQNLLSRVGVRAQGAPRLLNERIYTPVSTILGAVGNPFGLHVNKQGLDPLLGLGDTFVPDRYLSYQANSIVKANNSPNGILLNRLAGLYNVKILKIEGDYQNLPFYNSNNISLADDTSILSYQGGPGAPLGIGKTNIKYATDNTGAPLSVLNAESIGEPVTSPSYATLDYRQLDELAAESKTYNHRRAIDFRKKIKNKLEEFNLGSASPPYTLKNIEKRTNLGDPGYVFGKDLSSYTNGYIKDNIDLSMGAASPTSYDKINALPIYTTTEKNVPSLYNDLVNFRIGVIDNDTPQTQVNIHFRAFLDQISDSYNSNWDPTKYIGRGENFYTYSGFDRKVSLGWTVAAQSKIELMPMYRKLNYLASICAPDYSKAGYMRGNIVTLTIGGYFYEQPGIITGFNFEMNSENDTWEIAINDKGDEDKSVKQVPHLIKVTGFNFIPIHKFVPRKQENRFSDPPAGYINEYGKQRFIALDNGIPNDWSWDTLASVTNNSNKSSIISPDQDAVLANFTTPKGEFNPNIFSFD